MNWKIHKFGFLIISLNLLFFFEFNCGLLSGKGEGFSLNLDIWITLLLVIGNHRGQKQLLNDSVSVTPSLTVYLYGSH